MITLLQTKSPSTLAFISPGDTITARSLTSTVKRVEQDSAQATWTLICSPGEPDSTANNVTVQATVVAEERVTEEGVSRVTEEGVSRETEGG